MRSSKWWILVLAVTVVSLAGCTPPPAAATPIRATALNSSPTTPAPAGGALTRTDTQSAVEFKVTPLNLSAAGQTLDFDVVMDTHSVELTWDLAALSTLKADNGREVAGLIWPGGSGHHVEGTLSFPATTDDGQALLEGATRLTLVIRNAAVPERAFEWSLAP